MAIDTDALLQAAIDTVSLPGVLVGHRRISVGDEQALTTDEARAFASSVIERRRAAGAARIVARRLLETIGHGGCSLPRTSSGAPVWPAGVVGSLAHDRDVAVAAVARTNRIAALGIDIEPDELLPADLLDIVATPAERQRIDDDPYRGRLLFVAKEAVYKAVAPLDNVFLEHHDVEIDLSGRKGTVRNGRAVELCFILSTHVIALAFIRVE